MFGRLSLQMSKQGQCRMETSNKLNSANGTYFGGQLSMCLLNCLLNFMENFKRSWEMLWKAAMKFEKPKRVESQRNERIT